MKQEIFKYFGRVPTNVCWNGTSFPLNPGDYIKCYPEFITAFISSKLYRPLRPGEKGEPRYTFGRSPFFIKPDPMGGLPMRATPGTGPALKDAMPKKYSPATAEDEKPINPYAEVTEGGAKAALPETKKAPVVETPEKEATLTLSTVPGTNVKEEAPKLEMTTALGAAPTLDVMLGEIPPDPTMPDLEGESPELETPPEAEVVVEVVDPTIPGRTELRQMLVGPTRGLALSVAAEGCPLKPEMLDTFKGFDDTTPRGLMFSALWEYYGFDDKE